MTTIYRLLGRFTARTPLVAGSLMGAFIALWCLAVPASASVMTYTFHQTSTTIAGFDPEAAFTLDGPFSGIPSLTGYDPPPYDFGTLVSFDISFPFFFYYDGLDSLTPTCMLQYGCGDMGLLHFPQWSISAGRFSYIDSGDSSWFIVSFGPNAVGSIFGQADSSMGFCPMAALPCVATGVWVANPEPASASLLLVGIFGSALATSFRGHSRWMAGPPWKRRSKG